MVPLSLFLYKYQRPLNKRGWGASQNLQILAYYLVHATTDNMRCTNIA